MGPHSISLFLSGTNKQKWVPLSLDPPPSRPPPSKGPYRGDRHREYDRVHRDRAGERDHKDGQQPHKERDGYRDHYRGERGYQSHYYSRYGGTHDRDKERDGKEQDRPYRRSERDRYNVPPRYAANQPQGQEFPVTEGSGGTGSGGGGGGGGTYEGPSNRYGGRGGRGGRGRNWRYPSPATGHGEF